jgi:hypothetical protein
MRGRAWLGSPQARNLVAVSVTHVRQFVYVSVSALSTTLWDRAVPIYTFFFFIVRGQSPSSPPVRLWCTIVTPPGIFYPPLAPRPGITARTVLSLFSVSSKWMATTGTTTTTTFVSAWSSPFKAQGIGARLLYPCTSRPPTTNNARLEARRTGIEEPTTPATNLHSRACHNATSGDFRYRSSHIPPAPLADPACSTF